MNRVVIYILLSCALSSCQVDISKGLINEEGDFYDVWEYITVPNSEFKVSLKFGLNADLSFDDDIQTYTSDSLYSRLKYRFGIFTSDLPTIKLNSFSFTNKNGDTIPSILYYRTVDNDVHIIDSLPVTFTNDIKEHMRHKSFQVYAEGSQSYVSTKMVYVNYDIEVGDKYYVKHVKYKGQRFWDWRPKLW